MNVLGLLMFGVLVMVAVMVVGYACYHQGYDEGWIDAHERKRRSRD